MITFMTELLTTELLTKVWSSIAGLMLACAMLFFRYYFPHELLRGPVIQKLLNFLNRYVHVTFSEHTGDRDSGSFGNFIRSPAFLAIERYLNASSTRQARNLNASVAARDCESIVLSMAKNEEVTEEYQGMKLWWTSGETKTTGGAHDSRFFRLTFHRWHRETMTTKYLAHIFAQGKAITLKERRRKLFTNKNKNEYGDYREKGMWSHVPFEHPATFDTLAMDPDKKRDIIDDLLRFADSKDYYAKVGKAWKRGYLLYGPPGTGKSTMIAAMANLLNYDVYDVELTAVRDNMDLRKLLIDTSSKSIIVIEDIDCSLSDLTGKRGKKKTKEEEEEKLRKKQEEMMRWGTPEKKEVTLSGLLNFIDGLWSACGGERIVVFTTNYVEKLDPALIRRGRMDMHIEMSYCGFEAFKVLANNYLDVEEHELFGTVRRMLEETKMTPADVAENLMPKKGDGEDGGESCLKRLIRALEEAKEQARIKAQEEEMMAKEEEKENDPSGGDI